jgi:putative transposase
MKSALERPNRRSIRLQNYDYSCPGAYFVTVCMRKRLCLFGEVVGGPMNPSSAGKMVAQAWDELPEHYVGVDVDSFILMPNHIHGILVLNPSSVGAAPCGRPPSLTVSNAGQPRGVAPTKDRPMKRIQQGHVTPCPHIRGFGDRLPKGGFLAICHFVES